MKNKDDKPKCPIDTPESDWIECIRSFPDIKKYDEFDCPLVSGTEGRRCVYDKNR